MTKEEMDKYYIVPHPILRDVKVFFTKEKLTKLQQDVIENLVKSVKEEEFYEKE